MGSGIKHRARKLARSQPRPMSCISSKDCPVDKSHCTVRGHCIAAGEGDNCASLLSCPSYHTCHAPTKTCRGMTWRQPMYCHEAGECPVGRYCSLGSCRERWAVGAGCQEGENVALDGCEVGTLCDPKGGVCVPKCYKDTDCLNGKTCEMGMWPKEAFWEERAEYLRSAEFTFGLCTGPERASGSIGFDIPWMMIVFSGQVKSARLVRARMFLIICGLK